MITIQLTNATNGVIKKVIDTQYNGVDQPAEIITLYEFDEDAPESKLEYFLKIMDLLEDVSKDLGLSFGNDHDGAQFKFDLDWGDKYIPTIEELNEKIKELQSEIRELKEIKKQLENVDNV
jgi:hypothetical protein